jgi:hypothetical protein
MTTDGTAATDGDGAATDGAPQPDELELLAAFERLSPQGTLGWAFTDSLRRLDEPTAGVAASAPWRGLPDDLWERGRAAKAGQRMMGDVVDRLAELMDLHAREILEAGDKELRDRLLAAWDAVRYLAARLERLEGRVDPVADLLVDPARLVAAPDLAPVAGTVGTLLGEPDPDGTVLVGESAGPLADAARAAGHRVRQVESGGPAAWRAAGDAPPGGVVLGGLVEAVAACVPGELTGAVLAGAVDRLDLPGQLALVAGALGALAPGGRLVVVVTDRSAWETRLTPAGRDLVPGAPLHPETWLLLLERLGATGGSAERPGDGPVHLVSGTAAR